MNLPVQLLAEGSFEPDMIIIQSTSEPLPIPQNIQSQIEQVWISQLQRAEQEGYQLWDAPAYTLEQVESRGNQLKLEVGLLSYKTVVGLNVLIKEDQLGPELAPKQMYSSLLIKTLDHKYLFGVGAKQVFVGQMKLIGGVYSQAEVELTSGRALFAGAIRELGEELGVPESAVAQIKLKRIYATPRGLRDFVFRVDLNLKAKEVRQYFAERLDLELSQLLVTSVAGSRQLLAGLSDLRSLKADLID